MTANAAGHQRTTVVSIITASSLMVLMLGVGLAEASIRLGGGLIIVIPKTHKTTDIQGISADGR